MAKQRKLQGEMEATLKKITEGVEEWEELWNKYERSHDMVRPGQALACCFGSACGEQSCSHVVRVYSRQDAAQRDRLVAEMKRDLKKLQVP